MLPIDDQAGTLANAEQSESPDVRIARRSPKRPACSAKALAGLQIAHKPSGQAG
jgi:hypothetical protein